MEKEKVQKNKKELEKDIQEQNVFQVLKKVLQEAFQTETVLLKPPYENIEEVTTQMDRGMRNIIWSDYIKSDLSFFAEARKPEQQLFIVKSNLGFYNLIACLGQMEEPDVVSIGPFRAEEFSTGFFTKIIKDSKLPTNVIAALKYLYESFPYVQMSAIVNVTKQILSLAFPEFEEMEAVEIAFSDQNEANKIHINLDMLEDYSADSAESYRNSFLNFQASLKCGEPENARKALKKFLQNANLLSSESLEICKGDLKYLNVICHLTLLESHVHPLYILKLYDILRIKINHLTSQDTVIGTANDICHKYCLLIKNYGFSEYSKIICDVINYIHLHLDEKLTLSLLAEQFKRNAASLSNSFSREVGISITEFIHQARINEAIKYFNTTEMSVSEVAVAVGFQDFAYFSRLFKKQIGCSPREYCNGVR